jgi:hypothetical protein
MDRKILFVLLLIFFAVTACSKVWVYSSTPAISKISNDAFEATLEPQLLEGRSFFDRFRFVFTNRTDRNLVIDWSKSYYIHQGRKKGQFGWNEMTFEELKSAKVHPMVVINPGKTHTAVIFPLTLIARIPPQKQYVERKRPEDGFFRGAIPEGRNGVILTVKQNGKVIEERITVNITSKSQYK